MKFKFIFLVLFVLIIISCEQQKEIVVAQTYAEPIDPSSSVDENWGVLPEGLQASIVSINNRFVRSEIPKVKQQNTWKGEAWKGERVSAQMVLWTNDSLTKTSVEISDLVTKNGDKITSDNTQLRFVKYVITDEFADGCGYRKPEDFASSIAADALDDVASFQVKAEETRPVWITIDVPSNALEGLYNATLTLSIEGQKKQQFEFELNVLDKVLPAVKDWKFHLDMWQNPYAVARFHKVEPWSQKHWELLKPIMGRLANAGQKVITVSLNKRPWGGQTFDEFQAMIQWTKKSDGSWTYDYTIFDNWVQFMMDLGVKNQINCYSMVPWGNELYYFDEQEEREVKIKAAPGTKEYEAIWTPFLTEFKKHLTQKGWNEITRIAMDERGPKEMKAMLKLINDIAPEFGVSLADSHKSYKQYPNELKDMSIAFGHPVDEEDLEFRKQNGYISTHYVCCTDEFPNTFTFSAPVEGVFIGWYTTAANFDGFLRWSYNSWVEKPLLDSRFRAWPAGDTYIVYPNNRSSIRFETLREGIQDAEKIRVLREGFARRNDVEKLNALNDLVATFNLTERPEDLEEMLKKAKDKLNQWAKN